MLLVVWLVRPRVMWVMKKEDNSLKRSDESPTL